MHWFTFLMPAVVRVCRAAASNRDFNPGFPCGRQEASCLSKLCRLTGSSLVKAGYDLYLKPNFPDPPKIADQ